MDCIMLSCYPPVNNVQFHWEHKSPTVLAKVGKDYKYILLCPVFGHCRQGSVWSHGFKTAKFYRSSLTWLRCFQDKIAVLFLIILLPLNSQKKIWIQRKLQKHLSLSCKPRSHVRWWHIEGGLLPITYIYSDNFSTWLMVISQPENFSTHELLEDGQEIKTALP